MAVTLQDIAFAICLCVAMAECSLITWTCPAVFTAGRHVLNAGLVTEYRLNRAAYSSCRQHSNAIGILVDDSCSLFILMSFRGGWDHLIVHNHNSTPTLLVVWALVSFIKRAPSEIKEGAIVDGFTNDAFT